MKPAILLLLATSAALAQTASAPETVFDAASVKPAAPGGGRGGGMNRMGVPNVHVTPGMVNVRNTSLKGCIAWAYQVTDAQVTGPDGLDSLRFDIIGKAAGPADDATLRVMMQALLKERFKLDFHRQTKDMQTYVLSVGKNGHKLKESKSEGEMSMEPNQAQMSVTVQRAPLAQLTGMMGQLLRAPVLDATGLTGRYDITVNIAKWAADAAGRGQELMLDPLALLVPILQEEFGLKLESRKMPLDLLVIDHIEKSPIEN